MSPLEPLAADRLARRCDPTSLGFVTTADVPDVAEIVGQARAMEAIDFAMSMPGQGYNLLVMGPEGNGKYTAIRQYLDRAAALRPTPDDWCYVHNFADPRRPRALRLPAGRGRALRARMATLVREFAVSIPTAMENDEYRTRRQALEEAFKSHREGGLGNLQQRALERGIAIAQTPMGYGMAAIKDEAVVDPEAFGKLPAEEQERIKAVMAELQTELAALLASIPRLEREHRREVQALNEETVRRAVDQLITEARGEFGDLAAVRAFLDEVEADVVARAGEFLARRDGDEAEAGSGPAAASGLSLPAGPADGVSPFGRCQVNLVVDNGG